ncbi:MAG TPA: DUF6496 domain-containing protein [Thermoanaerobaculia bacterium]|nr:DUF6496 domain-containing protein [Thermoanaerobaculia bacterium]
MPEKKTIERARKDKREGKSASTQAGEFVREEMEHIRHGKHGARSPEQAIAIGLSKARRAGVKLPPPDPGEAPAATRKRAKQDLKSASTRKKPSAKRARAATAALKDEGKSAASKPSLAAHARKAARQRTAGERSAAAKKAARTKGPAERSAAAKKAARTRAKKK